jgi:sugar lactone lactonase YvrE
MRWAEGPAYFPEGRYLLCSDIPNNRIMKYSEEDGSFTVFRSPSNYANGNTRDRQGLLVTCEHSVTRRITRTEKDGNTTVLADNYEGKRLNAPNDIIAKSDDTIWFSDPLFGINGEWEGNKEKPEQATTNVYRIGTDGKLTAVITDLVNPNGLAFSPDEKKLYVIEAKGTVSAVGWIASSRHQPQRGAKEFRNNWRSGAISSSRSGAVWRIGRRALATFGGAQRGMESRSATLRVVVRPGYCACVPQSLALQRGPLEILGCHRHSYPRDEG